jgi:hypothetical protein
MTERVIYRSLMPYDNYIDCSLYRKSDVRVVAIGHVVWDEKVNP